MNLASIVIKTVENISDAEKALGYLRYQEMRKMRAVEFKSLSQVALLTSKDDADYNQAIDEIVDTLIIASHSTKGVDYK